MYNSINKVNYEIKSFEFNNLNYKYFINYYPLFNLYA